MECDLIIYQFCEPTWWLLFWILFAFVALIEKGQFVMTKRVFSPVQTHLKNLILQTTPNFLNLFPKFFSIDFKNLDFQPEASLTIWSFLTMNLEPPTMANSEEIFEISYEIISDWHVATVEKENVK